MIIISLIVSGYGYFLKPSLLDYIDAYRNIYNHPS